MGDATLEVREGNNLRKMAVALHVGQVGHAMCGKMVSTLTLGPNTRQAFLHRGWFASKVPRLSQNEESLQKIVYTFEIQTRTMTTN